MKVVGYLVLFIIWGSGFVTGWACKRSKRGVESVPTPKPYQRTFVVQYPEIRSIYSVQRVLDRQSK